MFLRIVEESILVTYARLVTGSLLANCGDRRESASGRRDIASSEDPLTVNRYCARPWLHAKSRRNRRAQRASRRSKVLLRKHSVRDDSKFLEGSLLLR